ncbi:MAG: hypothetical protein D6815_11935, partial [Candidatus Dadabacteria bacterium]
LEIVLIPVERGRICGVSGASAELVRLISAESPQPERIAALLDSLNLAEQIAAVRSLRGRRVQRALWRVAAANPPVKVTDLVPPDYPPEQPAVFHGKNSLPAFTSFEKICFRPEGAPPDCLWGYNETPAKVFIGPGYYVVRDTPGASFGACAFDYTVLPERGLAGWPPVRSNAAGLSRFVYNGTIDYVRRLARDVFIGQATRRGRPLDTYFVVVRELSA